jgi:parallel beta-helix repeat protein
MAGRLSGAAVVVLAIVVAVRFSVSDPAALGTNLQPGLDGQIGVAISPEAKVLGIRAYRINWKFSAGTDHPGLGLGPVKLLSTIAAPTTTAAPITTAAPTTTAAPITTAAPTTTAAPITTAAPTTTAAPITTAPATTTTALPGGAPAGSIVIQPGTNIQSVVDSKPAGSTFYLVAGTHRGQSIQPRNGDTFLGQPGAVLSGDDRVQFAFRNGARNVTIRGLVIEKYANPAQSGAVGGGGGSNWAIVGNEIRYNWGGGVVLSDGFVVSGNNIHHNRQIGIKGGGTNVLIENNEIAFNNYRDDYSMSWESGGTKFLKTRDLVVRGNYVHDNHGHGLWTDHDNIGTLFENNVVMNNHGSGIFHEISYDAVIRNNRVEGNALLHTKGGIKIASSSNVEVYGNTLSGNNGGIYVSQSDRGSGSYGVFEVRNLWVHDNSIAFTQGFSGLRVEGSDIYYTGKNNRFDRNSYRVASQANPFFWMGNLRTQSEWVAYGLDTNGIFE